MLGDHGSLFNDNIEASFWVLAVVIRLLFMERVTSMKGTREFECSFEIKNGGNCIVSSDSKNDERKHSDIVDTS